MSAEAIDLEIQGDVHALTRQWSDVLTPKESSTGSYMPINYPPLLDMLKEAVGSSTGKTQSGKSPDAERSLLNMEAFSLYEHIDGTTRAWLRDLSKQRAASDLKQAVIELGGLIQALHAAGQIEEKLHSRIAAQFGRWRKQIWGMFDPPSVKDLLGSCPNCEATVFVNMEGGKTPALVAFYQKGLEPHAKCQKCGAGWAGVAELLTLSAHLGATVDEDALREIGAI